MSNTIRSRATLPSRYSWKSAPSNSTRLPVGEARADRSARVRGPAAPPEGRPRTVRADQRTPHRLEGHVGKRAPGVFEEPAHVAVATHGLGPGGIVVDDVLGHQLEQPLGLVRVPGGEPLLGELLGPLQAHGRCCGGLGHLSSSSVAPIEPQRPICPTSTVVGAAAAAALPVAPPAAPRPVPSGRRGLRPGHDPLVVQPPELAVAQAEQAGEHLVRVLASSGARPPVAARTRSARAAIPASGRCRYPVARPRRRAGSPPSSAGPAPRAA